jgi:hypothetical protein
MPPSGTVSMCDPVRIAGVSGRRAWMPVAPKMLPAGSTHVSSPTARISPSSHARASSWGGDQHMRVTPPPGRPPNRASVLIREVSRGSEIEITVDGSISLDFLPGMARR